MKTRMPPKYPVVVPGVGPVPALGMIVGEAPGRTEIERGTPFCGRSGRLLDDTLRNLGSGRESLYITNSFKGDVGSGNPNPTADQLSDHWPLLRAEIDSVAPRGILLLGRVAISAFVPVEGRVGELVGRAIDGRDTVARLFPCWHPAYVLRQSGTVAVEFYETIGRFLEYIRS